MLSRQQRIANSAVSGLDLVVPRQTAVSKREKEIGKRIKLFREALGLTQSEFGISAGIVRGSLAKYEAGVVPLPWKVAEFIFLTFHMNAEWLATGSGPVEPYIRPSELPAEDTIGRPFSEIFDRYFRDFLATARVAEIHGVGSRIGIHIRPSRTGTSYEAFRATLKRYDKLFLEMKRIEDRKEFANALADIGDKFLMRMSQNGDIPSLIFLKNRGP